MVILGSTSVSAPTLWLLLVILCHLTMTASALDDEDFFTCERKNHQDFNSDKKHLKDCTFDNKKQLQDYFNCDEKDLEDHNSDDHSASPLCVPQDRVEDLDWYPDFGDDFISFSDLFDDSDTSDLQNDFQFSDTSLQDEKIEEKSLVLQHVFLHQEKRITPSAKPETQKKQVKIEEKPFLVHFSDDHEEKGTALSDRSNLRLFHQPIAQLMNDEKKPPLSFVTKKKSRTKRVCGRAWSKKAVVEKEKRCNHCESKETPQWRNGPMGPKTLCNACGVRYNSGRLVPEYRPAASPTFDATKHSNIHKKIVKMRGRHSWM